MLVDTLTQVSVQISSGDFYRDFPGRSYRADIHGISMGVASLKDPLSGKVQACRVPDGRRSKRKK